MDYFSLLRPALYALSPETAHHVAIATLKTGLLPSQKISSTPALTQNLFGLSFPHPVGLAAGFDKNAEVLQGLLAQGFSFVEAGTVTPRAQTGNPKPRMFRLEQDRAIINRLGFNNLGLAPFRAHLETRPKHGIIGANIGKNKDTQEAVKDYVLLLEALYTKADYITVNISSPNTQGLRDLQQEEALNNLLSALSSTRAALKNTHGRHTPLLLKIAPDIEEEAASIADAVMQHGFDGLIVSNTTISRPALKSPQANEQGGLSGAPLFERSTNVLKRMYQHTQGRIPLIGVGGISSGAEAYAKLRAGASLVQIYSALIYEGFGLVPRVVREVDTLLARDGFTHISQAIGADHRPL